MTLPDGTRVTLLDRYSGYIPRNRLFFQFTVRTDRPAAVASVAFVLDGRTVRTDDRAPFVYGGLSRTRLRPSGPHRLEVVVTPAGERAVASSFTVPFVAGRCDRARTFAYPSGPRRRPLWSFSWSSSDAGDETGPPLASISSTITGLTARVPRTARGRVVGRLFVGGDGGRRTFELRAPRASGGEPVLLRRGRLRVLLRVGTRPRLRVEGLPAGTRSASVRLLGPGRDLLLERSCRVRVRDVLRTPDDQVARLESGSTSCGLRRRSRATGPT